MCTCLVKSNVAVIEGMSLFILTSSSQSKRVSESPNSRTRTLSWKWYSASGLLAIITILHMTSGMAVGALCNVAEASSCVEANTFLNSSSGCCQRCTVCPRGTKTESSCNATHDTHCVDRPCTDPNTVFREIDDICVIDCGRCTYKCNIGRNRCECDPSICYEDPRFCQRPCLLVNTTEAGPRSSSNPGDPTTLPTWGVGVIAVVAVLGIVAFSAVFLLLGVCTRKRATEPVDSEASESSSNSLVTSSSLSRGTNSTYLAGYPNHSLIDLLRQSNNPLHNSLSSIKSSPKSARSSPYLTKGVAAEYHLDTKSPVHCLLSNHSSPLPLRTLQVNIDVHSKKSTVV